MPWVVRVERIEELGMLSGEGSKCVVRQGQQVSTGLGGNKPSTLAGAGALPTRRKLRSIKESGLQQPPG